MPGSAAAEDPAKRVDLRVLVISDGGPSVAAIRRQLDLEGVPATEIDLTRADRTHVTADFLADQVNGEPRGRFQAVVVPNDAPSGLQSDERLALQAYEKSFHIRQVLAYSYPSAAVGLTPPSYSGPLDGASASLTSAATAGPFNYLRGGFTVQDADPAITETYGYLADPVVNNPYVGSFDPLVTATAPGGTATGVLAGVHHTSDGREQLVLTFSANGYQAQARYLAHGVVTWMTRGIHLGQYRNYLSVHVDDIFVGDGRWSIPGDCTPGSGDCPAGVPDTTPIRMSVADVTHAVDWQRANDYQFDFLYNAEGSDLATELNGSDPLTTALLAAQDEFRWVNHTYSHEFLGCVQDFTVIPWRCKTDPATGRTQYVSQAQITEEITKNLAWADQHGLAVRRDELVSGEHSGTRILPQQPDDNPNFVAALTQNGLRWVGLDASRETGARQIGAATAVPRHPINVFYNVATVREEVDEYNWIYTSRADGGSGICEDHPDTTTCIKPLDLNTGFQSHILPTIVTTTLGFALANDPRPHYVHQANLAEDRLIYPVLEAVLSAYRGVFAANTPLVNPRLADAGAVLADQDAWRAAVNAGQVSGYVRGDTVTVQAPAGLAVPMTAPTGTQQGATAFGAAYAGERSSFEAIPAGQNELVLTLPAASAWPAAAVG
ncbi:hypothetical protein [Goodfellowiella coeruleoviolacea]|uniref:Uncharacterized protein n=1 Tax=Goodfellowiella coeruleoviolacea TaxID=334858 RepID=A0AAE3GG56_9PSEU|nr:hypothetical protein [Goodfellowiella coeruleoviolacea]MCP2165538.1 hypothetical protein [Goodfellowiella coeruleoviolacea]